jgi:hypothetical protein
MFTVAIKPMHLKKSAATELMNFTPSRGNPKMFAKDPSRQVLADQKV